MLENVDNNKIVFKCKHCDNDDIRYMKFASLNKQSPQYQNHIYRQNWDYETTPKVPVGIHIRCAKCGKDTFIIPDSYNGTEWGNDIPEQCIVAVKYEKPQFSAIQYIMNGEGYLDKVVLTANNEMISLLTQQEVSDKEGISVIGKKQYELLLSRGLQEVTTKLPQTILNNTSVNKTVETTITQNQDKKYNSKGGESK